MDKKQQKKLITEIMHSDEDAGLYPDSAKNAQDISKMETTQTAVEWLVEQLNNAPPLYGYANTVISISIDKDIIKQAKDMEKEQIVKAHIIGQAEFDTGEFRQKVIDNAEQYYNETYNK